MGGEVLRKHARINSAVPKEHQTLPRQQDLLLTHDLFVTGGVGKK